MTAHLRNATQHPARPHISQSREQRHPLPLAARTAFLLLFIGYSCRWGKPAAEKKIKIRCPRTLSVTTGALICCRLRRARPALANTRTGSLCSVAEGRSLGAKNLVSQRRRVLTAFNAKSVFVSHLHNQQQHSVWRAWVPAVGQRFMVCGSGIDAMEAPAQNGRSVLVEIQTFVSRTEYLTFHTASSSKPTRSPAFPQQTNDHKRKARSGRTDWWKRLTGGR